MPYDLDRFVTAQDPVYATVVSELRAGRKTSHWMWFIFPQVRGLGHSHMARHYGISSTAEAQAYLAHPVLGPRLRECTDLLLDLPGDSPTAVLGGIDALKLRSSMTLFAAVAPAEPRFQEVLDKYYGGVPDAETLKRL